MATVDKNFRIKNGLVVEGSTATVNGQNVLTEGSTEFIQDTIGAMVDGSTQTNITVTYDDSTGKLNFVAENGVADSNTDQLSEGSTNKYFTDERAQDAVGNSVGTGLTYNDTTGAISTSNIPNSSLANSAITINGTSVSLGGSRTLGTDDVSEGAINKYFTDERAVDAVATAISNGIHTNISVSYDDGNNAISFTGAVTYTDENAQDAVGNAVGNGLDYDDATGSISVDPSEFTLNSVGAPNGDVSLNSNKITNLATPTQSTDAATKAYVDSVTEGLHIHASAVAATTGNISISADLEAGDIIDGVTLVAGDRVLVKNQSTASENGIYVVQSSGAAVRATDFDQPAEVDGGDFIFVTGGTVNDNTGWVQTSTGVATIGTDPIYFTQFSGAGTFLAGNGLSLAGSTFSINTAVTADLTTAQTLTNKTINLSSNTLTGTLAEFNTAVSDANLASLAGTETLTNKTISGSNNTLTNIANSSLTNSSITINGTAVSLGGTRTIGTDDVAEGSTNKYFTDARAVTALEAVVPDFTAIEVNNIAKQVAATVSLTTTNITTAYSWLKADYRAAKFLVKFARGTHTEVSEVLLTLDTSDNVAITEYAIVTTNGGLGDVTADVDGVNVRLRVTAGAATTECHVYGTLIK